MKDQTKNQKRFVAAREHGIDNAIKRQKIARQSRAGGGKGGKGKFLHFMKGQTQNQEDGLQQHERQLEHKERKIEAKEKPIEKTLEGAGKSKSDADRLLRKEKKRLVKKESG